MAFYLVLSLGAALLGLLAYLSFYTDGMSGSEDLLKARNPRQMPYVPDPIEGDDEGLSHHSVKIIHHTPHDGEGIRPDDDPDRDMLEQLRL